MDNAQQTINKLAQVLRLQVIEYLVKADCIKFGKAVPGDAEMTYTKREINKMPCCTKQLKNLFADAHEMHEEKGMFPHAVTIGDLEWCLKYRHIGYACMQRIKHAWLPYKQDKDLRALPAFVEIAKAYRPMIANGQKLLAPATENANTDATALVAAIANHLSGI